MGISSKELAERLGVSPSSISIALNGKPGISDKTREKILSAAETYGLERPARRTSSSPYINLVIYKKHGLVYGDTPFFSAVIEGIGMEVARLGYKLQISYFYGNQNQDEQFKMLSISECAGIILLATEMLPGDIPLFRTLTQPLVVLDNDFRSPNFDCVVINNIQGAHMATKYLLDCGHRRIGHLFSSVRIRNFDERREGFLRAVSECAGCEVCTVPVFSTQERAYDDMLRYLDGCASLPTAFFADNDIIAVACLRAMADRGIRVPEDVSLVGFDDMPFCYLTTPTLTTMHVSKEVFGRQSVSRLVEKIQGETDHSLKIELNPKLVIRNSVKKLRPQN